MSSALSSSSLVRHKPAVFAVVGAAAITVAWMCLYDVFGGPDGDSEILRGWGSQFSGDLHERRSGQDLSAGMGALPTIEEALDGQGYEAVGDDAATDIGSDNAQQAADGEVLRELTFAISQARAQKEGIVHRGVACDYCGARPIRGVRFRCANCPDFDLCEDCEDKDQHGHPKTHVFYKIKVPAPWAGKQPLPVWYPGTLWRYRTSLAQDIKMRLSEETSYTANQVDGYFQQFSCLANEMFIADSLGIGMAINRAAFNQCFIPATGRRRLAKPNLIFDRLFKFYDQNNDGMIGFDEFVKGNALIHDMSREARSKRVFQGLDLNDDGYVTRSDFQRMFLDYFELNKSIVVDNYLAEDRGENDNEIRNEMAQNDFINGGKPLSSYFLSGDVYNDEFAPNPRRSEGKRTAYGDVQEGVSTFTTTSRFYRRLRFDADGDDEITRLVGGTEATNYIYDTILASIDELVDPLFRPGEELAAEIAETAAQRQEHADAIRVAAQLYTDPLMATASQYEDVDDDDDASTAPEPASVDYDPTMPQNRPNAPGDALPRVPDRQRLLRLDELNQAAAEMATKGGPGRVDFTEFVERLKMQDDQGAALLQWVGSWVDLVMF